MAIQVTFGSLPKVWRSIEPTFGSISTAYINIRTYIYGYVPAIIFILTDIATATVTAEIAHLSNNPIILVTSLLDYSQTMVRNSRQYERQEGRLLVCNENFGPPSKIGPPGLILAAKSGPPLPISVPPVKSQLVKKLDLDERIALLGAVRLILFATTN